MKNKFCLFCCASIAFAALTFQTGAQNILFDFENAPVHTSLPISLTVNGVTALFAASGGGFSIQPANTMGFTPVGFSGNCIYPNSIYGSDLGILFSTKMTAFSILYAPQELACDSSATMRVTAYLDTTFVGTTTTNAQPGTWPTETLQFSSAQGFNNVVVHYDKAPVTAGDYGVIFMADNMNVTPVPPPIVLAGTAWLANGAFQFTFTNTPGAPCTVYETTNLSTAFTNWTTVSGVTEISAGNFQFTDTWATNHPRCFYRVTSP